MRIVIIALRTRGDVQPYIALGKDLKEAGHNVRIVTQQNFETLVNSHKLDFSHRLHQLILYLMPGFFLALQLLSIMVEQEQLLPVLE